MPQSLKIITVDVSELAPPEPMRVILSHLAKLSDQECLQVKHRRQPFPLYENLGVAGFAYHCVIHKPDDVTLYIYHSNAQQAFECLIKNN